MEECTEEEGEGEQKAEEFGGRGRLQQLLGKSK